LSNIWYLLPWIYCYVHDFLCWVFLTLLQVSSYVVRLDGVDVQDWGRMIVVSTRGYLDASLHLCLLLESSCRLWFRTFSGFCLFSFVGLFLRNFGVYDGVPWDVEILVLCCFTLWIWCDYFIIIKMNYECFLNIEGVAPWTLYFSVELLLRFACGGLRVLPRLL